MELRWGAGDPNRIGTLAKELVDLRPDVILGHTTPAVAALAHETRTIPIVFPGVVDPIGSGFGASLSHPGGNITGFSTLEPEVGGKWIELIKEIAPHTERVALLFNPATTVPIQLFMPSIQTAATSFAIQVNTAPVHAKEAIEGVVAEQARNAGAGLIVLPDVFFVGNQENRELLISLAARYHVPTIYSNPIFAKPGGLICYGTGFAELFRLGAGYVDRILKGEHPADLPIQQPNKYQLSINLKTAKALGLSVPSTLLATADEVIE